MVLPIPLIFAQNKFIVNQLVYKGYNIRYKVSGKGNAIVFLHGFLENSEIWNNYITRLANDFHTVAIDLPGFGDSDVIASVHSMELMADVVFNVLKKEKIESCTIVGHSMGGYVGLEIIRNYPHMCTGLVLLNSQAAADDETARKNRDRTVDIVNNNHSEFISNFIPSLFKESNISLYQKEIDILTKSSLNTSDNGIIAALLGMKDRKDSLELLKETKIPVLFIIGKHDTKILLEKMKEQIILPCISESLILEDVGHMAFIEAPKICFETIRNFARKHNK